MTFSAGIAYTTGSMGPTVVGLQESTSDAVPWRDSTSSTASCSVELKDFAGAVASGEPDREARLLEIRRGSFARLDRVWQELASR